MNLTLASRLRDMETCFTVKVGLTDPQACELAALTGPDAIWLDREHCVGGWDGLYAQILAANRRGADTMVRVPRGSYTDLVIPYEMGAGAVLVPRVTSVDEAESLVQQAKFHPIGQRPLDGGNTDGDFAQLPGSDYLARAAATTLLLVQLESPEAVANAAAIATVPGIDGIFFGPGDFAQAAGIPGQLDDPLVVEAQSEVARAAITADVIPGTVLHGATDLDTLLGQGYRLINVGADVIAMADGLRTRIAAAHDRLAATRT